MTDHCPTCGTPVEIYQGDEGTGCMLPVMRWRPISEAPKDGTKILGLFQNIDGMDMLPLDDGKLSPHIVYWFVDPSDGEYGWRYDCCFLPEDNVIWIDNPISHYMPIVPPEVQP